MKTNFRKHVTKQNVASAIVVVVCVFVGFMLAKACQRTPTNVVDNQTMIDSLVNANVRLVSEFTAKSDSIEGVVRAKEGKIAEKNEKLKEITLKYVALRNIAPDKDTIVKIVEIYDGNECIEKMPIIQAQIVELQGVVGDLKNRVIVEQQARNVVQNQFDQSIALNKQQLVESKKDKRKIKWLKIGIIGETIVGTALLVVVATL